jgi:hypothetical protein
MGGALHSTGCRAVALSWGQLHTGITGGYRRTLPVWGWRVVAARRADRALRSEHDLSKGAVRVAEGPGVRSTHHTGQLLPPSRCHVRCGNVRRRNVQRPRAGLPVFVQGSEGKRSPTFREGQRYPAVVVVLALVRCDLYAKPDGTTPRPQLTACFTSAAILASSAAVNSFSA